MTSKAEFGSESPDQFLFVCSTYIAPAHLATIFYKKMEQIYKKQIFYSFKKNSHASRNNVNNVTWAPRSHTKFMPSSDSAFALVWLHPQQRDQIEDWVLTVKSAASHPPPEVSWACCTYGTCTLTELPPKLETHPREAFGWPSPQHSSSSAGRRQNRYGDHWDIPAACKLAVNRTDWRHLLRNIHGEQADSGFLPWVT